MSLGSTLTSKINSQKNVDSIHLPIFYNYSDSEQKNRLNQLILENPTIQVFDTLYSQLTDLIKLKNPKKILNKETISKLIETHIGNFTLQEYGFWVFYPWSNRLVHILGEKEFIQVRTNRNFYKISPDEMETLSQKKIGLIGLSVGQSVALTLALERGFGELRITDFDELELTNLNRIRTGIHNLGLNKSISVAREISEIDPYLQVKCFPEGLKEENMEDFYLKGGKLDILIDECDGLDMKILCRLEAKKHHIPVLMEASDRGMVDVERFDLENERPLLHGLIQHLDINKLKTLKTNEEKIPYLLPFVGIDTISDRGKASMLEIGETISTWPQLASAVTLGGGITADVCRRILLNQFWDSGRYYVDVEEIIGPKAPLTPITKDENQGKHTFYTHAQLEQLVSSIPIREKLLDEVILEEEQLEGLIQDILSSPSAGNNQPWFWYYNSEGLFLFHQFERSFSFLDPDSSIALTGIGAAIENLKLAVLNLNLELKSIFFPNPHNKELVAQFYFHKPKTVLEKDSLYDFLGKRYTNRKTSPSIPIDHGILEKMRHSLINMPQVTLKFLTSKENIFEIGEIIAHCEKFRFMEKEGHHEFFKKELKWNPELAERDRTGIDLRTIELGLSDLTGLKISSNWSVIELLKNWRLGTGLEKLSRKSIQNAATLGLISIRSQDKTQFLYGGMAVERVWLEANRNQIAFQPHLAPISYFRKNQLNLIIDPLESELLSSQERTLRNLFEVDKEDQLVFLFRLFDAVEPAVKSLRLNIQDIFFKQDYLENNKITEDVL